MFGQAKDMVHRATNRQPQNVIPNILLRLQVKKKRGDMYTSYHSSLSRVSKAVSELKGDIANTTITNSFLTGRMSSWQEHLKRISPFLRLGRGIWWQSKDEGYEFFDGREKPDFHIEGPHLLHFLDVNLKEIYSQKLILWQEICEEGIVLPTPHIKVYSPRGEYIGRKTFDEPDPPMHLEINNILSLEVMEEEADATACTSEDQWVQMELDEGSSGDIDLEEQQNEIDTIADSNTPDSRLEDNAEHPYSITNPLCERRKERALKTKLAVALSQVLGYSHKLSKLDKIRYHIKQYTPNSHHKEQHKQLISSLKDDLIQKLETTKQSVKVLETQYYSIHHKLPSPSTHLEYADLLKTTKFIIKLLQSPDIAH